MNRWFLVLISGLLTLALPFYAKSECVKIMAWDDDYPYVFIAQPEDPQPVGLRVELVANTLKEMNCQLTFLKMPWARALVELEEGRIDIIGGAFPNEERQAYAWYSKVDFHSPNILFVRKDISNGVVLNDLSDIEKYRLKVGVQIDVYYGKAFEEKRLGAHFSRLLYPNTSRKALWGMLRLGRIDGVIADVHSGQGELKQLGLSSLIVASDLIVSDQAAFFIFSKKSNNQKFVEDFDDALSKLKATGAVNTILNKYALLTTGNNATAGL